MGGKLTPCGTVLQRYDDSDLHYLFIFSVKNMMFQ